MPRSEARTDVDIWLDSDFIALTVEDQRMYWFLYSQRDIAHTGVIALRLRRWAQSASDLDATRVQASLERLADARFAVVDWDAEELLVRSFLRRDKVYRQPNVLRSAADSLTLITSPVVRYALAVEVERISHLADVHKDAAPVLADMLSQLAPGGLGDPPPAIAPVPNPSRNPSANPSDMPSGGSPGERGITTVCTTDFPVPRASTVPPPAVAATPPTLWVVPHEPPMTITQRSKRITDAYTAIVKLSKWPAINSIVMKAIKAEQWSDDEIRAALLRLADDGRPVTVDSLRIELTGLPVGRASPKESTGTSRARDALAAGEALQTKLEQLARKEITA